MTKRCTTRFHILVVARRGRRVVFEPDEDEKLACRGSVCKDGDSMRPEHMPDTMRDNCLDSESFDMEDIDEATPEQGLESSSSSWDSAGRSNEGKGRRHQFQLDPLHKPATGGEAQVQDPCLVAGGACSSKSRCSS
jgi:hypothetical protein